MNIFDNLQPGDWLGYHHKSLLAEAIYLRTGGLATHCAVYCGNGRVVTSLEHGVNYYPVDTDGLVIVRRPVVPFNDDLADSIFKSSIQGRPYGIWDCIKDTFPDIPDHSDGMNCSHSSAAYLIGGGVICFADDFDLSAITPRDFQLVPNTVLRTIWLVGQHDATTVTQAPATAIPDDAPPDYHTAD